MRKLELNITFTEFEKLDELNSEDKRLVLKAAEALKSAYAPYSQFKVGAAILMNDGQIFSANNQENAAYPSGLCAERVAIFYAVAQNPGVAVKSIAVVAKAEDFKIKSPVSPCGACRQVISEYEKLYKQKIRIIMKGDTDKIIIAESIEDLLPLTFHEEQLKK
ncbi:MAG: cytidine deaminase [Saprospiraceae bacterium]|nr:cytidine deaminase [Saprospiraceae bacterium]